MIASIGNLEVYFRPVYSNELGKRQGEINDLEFNSTNWFIQKHFMCVKWIRGHGLSQAATSKTNLMKWACRDHLHKMYLDLDDICEPVN